VNLIVFTGSRETGKRILADAGPGLKRVILELGGKDPLVVLDDADLDAAAAFAVRNSFRNAGQVCVSTERIYVDERVREPFLRRMVERTSALKQGNPRESGVTVGPMVSARQKAKVVAQIDAAIAAGATVLAGGESREGNFVAPTILADVDHSMEVMREETFGPVACVQAFATVDEAIRLANDTPFGLGAAVFGADVARAGEVDENLLARLRDCAEEVATAVPRSRRIPSDTQEDLVDERGRMQVAVSRKHPALPRDCVCGDRADLGVNLCPRALCGCGVAGEGVVQ
jgi:acyl-CoA reductase-like NAD-dependent aldehyde dehydrogenase